MIDYDGLLKKIPRVKKLLDDGSNSTLYHYTKPEKLLGILETGTVRFSNALYLNDKEVEIPVVICSTSNYENVTEAFGTVWYSELNDIRRDFKTTRFVIDEKGVV